MKHRLKQVYLFCEAIPDRLYPFKVEIEGTFVRGRRAYVQSVADAWEKYGAYNLGYKLIAYRGVFHLFGAVLFIIFSTLISKYLFNSEIALYVLMGAAILALFYQEFYVHPREFGQKRHKGVFDWLSWVVPMMIYLTLIH